MNLDRIQLRDDLCIYFSAGELRVVAQRLGVDYEKLRGRNTADRTASLIGQLDRNGRLLELVGELVRERPHCADQYLRFLPYQAQNFNAQEDVLRRLAAGEGNVIEEPPTMRWNTDDLE